MSETLTVEPCLKCEKQVPIGVKDDRYVIECCGTVARDVGLFAVVKKWNEANAKDISFDKDSHGYLRYTGSKRVRITVKEANGNTASITMTHGETLHMREE